MCSAADSGEVIILSDDDDDDIPCSEPSVHIVETEEEKKSDCTAAPINVDDDLVVTFSRCADLLPHARYDCPIHPFTATDGETCSPVADNHLICYQCFCYICDKLASSAHVVMALGGNLSFCETPEELHVLENVTRASSDIVCVMWCQRGVCHCNSHKRSAFWKNLRDRALLGALQTFNLDLCEIDAHLRHAEVMLQNFKQEVAAQLISFQKGRPLDEYGLIVPNQQNLVYDYTPVYELVSSFLNKADIQDDKAAAIMRLGATEEFIHHFQVSGSFILNSPLADAAKAKVLLLQRVISSLQRQMVTADFKPEFRQKLQDFYKRFYFPAELKNLKNRLCVRPWDDVLLVSVLKGQNVSGFRKEKGKKDVLVEQISVVLLRTEVLQQQKRYRELCRYLRVVQSDEPKRLQQVRDLIPFFMCMEGDFLSAVDSLLPAVNAPASRLTPHLFLFYLCIFRTATAPRLAVSQSAQLCYSDAVWELIKGAVPLKCDVQVKFALRVQRCCPAVFTDSQCWISLLKIVNSPLGSLGPLTAPNPKFLREAKDVVYSVLMDESWSSIQIPRFFQEPYPDQALLLLVTGGLGMRILHSPLSPILPVLSTFKENLWALEWLWDTLPFTEERLASFSQEVTQEVENTTDGADLFPLLCTPLLSPSSTDWDHTYCSPGPVDLYSTPTVPRCQLRPRFQAGVPGQHGSQFFSSTLDQHAWRV